MSGSTSGQRHTFTGVGGWHVLALWVATFPLQAADFSLSELFGPGAVIQHGGPAPVFGTAEPGAKVTVRLQGKTAEAVADDHWPVMRAD